INRDYYNIIIRDDEVKNVYKDDYTTDIHLFDKNNRVVVNTNNSKYFKTEDRGMNIEDSNLVTGSGYTVVENNPSETEIMLDYTMHYKLNATKHKRGQFVFSIDEKLLPFISEVLVETK